MQSMACKMMTGAHWSHNVSRQWHGVNGLDVLVREGGRVEGKEGVME